MTAAMDNSNAEMRNKAGSSLSHFLSDFAPRLIPDVEVEVLPMEADIPVQSLKPAEETEPMEEFVSADDDKVEDTFDDASLITEAKHKKDIDNAVHQATEELEAKFADEKAKLIAEQEQALAELKQKTIDELASNMQENLTKGFNEVVEIVGNDVAKILVTFIGAKIRDDALNDFSKRIAQEAISATGSLIIEGNEVLLKAVESKSGFDKEKFVLRPVDGANDIRLRHGDQIIATRIDPIMNELKRLVR